MKSSASQTPREQKKKKKKEEEEEQKEEMQKKKEEEKQQEEEELQSMGEEKNRKGRIDWKDYQLDVETVEQVRELLESTGLNDDQEPLEEGELTDDSNRKSPTVTSFY
uniref:Protein MNN4-like n=1 Tax=Globodera pallida TaxID=36090 RepID=A0A183C7W8_GLOPA